MNLTELSKQIRFDNASKGFDPTEGGVDRYLLLAISEICEAQNELRDGRGVNEVYYEVSNHDPGCPSITDDESDQVLDDYLMCACTKKPCGFPVEIADAIIRLLDICGKFEIEIKIFFGYVNLEGVDGEIESALLGIIRKISSIHVYGILKVNIELLNDPIARLFAICNSLNIDIMKLIQEKLEYNRSRPPKHGRKF